VKLLLVALNFWHFALLAHKELRNKKIIIANIVNVFMYERSISKA